MPKKQAVQCDECGREDFKSDAGLRQHKAKAHPYVPPPPPKRTTEVEPGQEENHNLLGGSYLQLGDVVWIGRKAVITKITKTEGSKNAEVVLRLTKKWWSPTEIS